LQLLLAELLLLLLLPLLLLLWLPCGTCETAAHSSQAQ
jgi:hypothetical protein